LDIYSKEKKEGRKKSDYEIMKMNYEACKRYSDSFEKMSNNILLLGKSGVGKTFLCNCIAKRVAETGNVVVYLSSKRFFDVLIRAEFERGNRESYNRQSSEMELSEMIYECDLLIIDDLGTETITKMTDPEFFDVINSRKINGLKTIISTNLSENEISQRYSERIYSRIAEYFVILRCVGQDIRRMEK
jgi:DNA replication protein DnaC